MTPYRYASYSRIVAERLQRGFLGSQEDTIQSQDGVHSRNSPKILLIAKNNSYSHSILTEFTMNSSGDCHRNRGHAIKTKLLQAYALEEARPITRLYRPYFKSCPLLMYQLIPHPGHRLNDQRIRRIRLDLTPQPIDHVLEHRIIRFIGITPHALV